MVSDFKGVVCKLAVHYCCAAHLFPLLLFSKLISFPTELVEIGDGYHRPVNTSLMLQFIDGQLWRTIQNNASSGGTGARPRHASRTLQRQFVWF